MPYNLDGTYSMDAYGAAHVLRTAFRRLPRLASASAGAECAARDWVAPDLMGIVKRQAADPPQQVADVRPSMAEAKADRWRSWRLRCAPCVSTLALRFLALDRVRRRPLWLPLRLLRRLERSSSLAVGRRAPADAGAAPGTAAYANDAAEMNRRAALWELEHANRGGGGPKPERHTRRRRTSRRRRKAASILRAWPRTRSRCEQGLADINLADAQRKHESLSKARWSMRAPSNRGSMTTLRSVAIGAQFAASAARISRPGSGQDKD